MRAPDLARWFDVPSDLKQALVHPTPLGSLFSALAFVISVGILFTAIRYLLRNTKKRSRVDRAIQMFHAIERVVLKYVGYIVGTTWRSPLWRALVSSIFFGTIAVSGALLRWPFCLWTIIIGLSGALVVFRQWSHDEDDEEYHIQAIKREVIRGTRNFELIVSCASVLIFAPVVFAQLQNAGFGFDVDPKAGPFAFEGFTLIEMLKIAPLVQYYDVYADILNFQKLGTVANPSFEAKFAVIAFRVTSDLIILAAIKRFFDIARRAAAGLDLRPAEEKLESADRGDRATGVREIERSALEGRPFARERLERILKANEFSAYPDVKFEAATALCKLAKLQRNDRDESRRLLYLAIDKGYEPLKNGVWTQDLNELNYGYVRLRLGDALLAIGEREAVQARKLQARNSYGAAREIFSRRQMTAALQQAQDGWARASALLSGSA